MKTLQASRALKAQAELGEGAIWDGRISRLWWVDILGRRLHRFDPAASRDESFELGTQPGTVVPEEGGDVALAVQNGFARFDSESGKLGMLAALEHEAPGTRFNDGKCDPQGRFWAGTMALGGKAGAGSLFCLERDLSVSRKIKGVSISNGLGWSPDGGRMYYIDSPSHRVMEFAFDGSSGGISAPRVAFEIDPAEGAPDGMCVDAEGMLWIAVWGGGKVIRVDPRGGPRLCEVTVEGARQTTSCALGGQGLSTLFITTAREHLDAAQLASQPMAGDLFSVETGVRGLPANPFRPS